MRVVRDYAPSGKRLGQAGPFGVWEEEADDRPGLGLAWEAKRTGQFCSPCQPTAGYGIAEYEGVDLK